MFFSEAPSPNAAAPSDPQGQVPNPFTYELSKVNATQLPGGTMKVADSRNFTVATTISVADVTVEPGGMRYAGCKAVQRIIR